MESCLSYSAQSLPTDFIHEVGIDEEHRPECSDDPHMGHRPSYYHQGISEQGQKEKCLQENEVDN